MFTITKNARNLSFGLMIIGVTALILGFVNDAHSAWPSLLFNTYFFLGISVFAVFFIALQYVAEASWSIVLKRVPEAIISFLPISGIIMLIIMVTAVMHFGGNHIYHWMADGIMDKFLLDDLGNQILDEKGNPILNPGYDKIIAGKAAFLDTTFFLIRSVIYILGWVYFGRKLKQLSLNEDKHGGLEIIIKDLELQLVYGLFALPLQSLLGIGLCLLIHTGLVHYLDGMFFSEWNVIGFVSILLITLYLKRLGYLESVNESHIHDLGKYVFAFSLVWTYMWFSQFMLIWYSNIPEEVAYFTARLEVENYKFLFWFRVAINFLFPIILLMSRDAKRNNSRLIFVCIVILIGHWLNSYLLVTPGVLNKEGHIGFTEIGMGLGFFGLFIYVVFNALTKAPLETKNHPFLDESKHLHT